jgi:hypothetical protein
LRAFRSTWHHLSVLVKSDSPGISAIAFSLTKISVRSDADPCQILPGQLFLGHSSDTCPGGIRVRILSESYKDLGPIRTICVRVWRGHLSDYCQIFIRYNAFFRYVYVRLLPDKRQIFVRFLSDILKIFIRFFIDFLKKSFGFPSDFCPICPVRLLSDFR